MCEGDWVVDRQIVGRMRSVLVVAGAVVAVLRTPGLEDALAVGLPLGAGVAAIAASRVSLSIMLALALPVASARPWVEAAAAEAVPAQRHRG